MLDYPGVRGEAFGRRHAGFLIFQPLPARFDVLPVLSLTQTGVQTFLQRLERDVSLHIHFFMVIPHSSVTIENSNPASAMLLHGLYGCGNRFELFDAIQFQPSFFYLIIEIVIKTISHHRESYQ